MDLIDRLLSCIAPHRCVVCYNSGSLLHAGCILAELSPICIYCQQSSPDWRVCDACETSATPNCGYAATTYDHCARNLVLGLKVSSMREAARHMARLMCETVASYDLAGYTLMACPTTPSRIRKRGLDHGRLLAVHMSRSLKLPLSNAEFVRRGSAKQAGSSRAKRQSQLQSISLKGRVEGAKILLVDDVFTTGSTITRCTELLLAAGAKSVDCVVFARAC